MIKQRLRHAWFAVFADHPLTYPGRALLVLLPRHVVARYESEFFTGQQTEGLVGRMVRAELNRQFYSRPEAEQRRLNRERFWGGRAGVEWHERQRQQHAAGARSPEFLRYRLPLVRQIAELLATGAQFSAVCEIGTGNGLFLQYLSEELPQVGRFVGIDLNADQIARNREVYAGSRLEFAASEVDQWLATQPAEPTVFVAVGTLECFTETELLELLTKIRTRGVPSAVALCEPVNIDLDRTTASAPRGNTMYSHNYPHLLKTAGFSVFQRHVEPIDPAVPNYQMVVIVATSEPVPAGARQASFA